MRRKKELERDEKGYTIMSKNNLKIICENDELYEFPDLNEKLYLQFKGFHKIESLDEYVNLKAIWFNNNGISKIENLTNQTLLISLFLNNNLIAKIENVSHLQNLQTLNLSHNRISKIENLSALKRLGNLDLSSNIIQDYDGLIGLLECPSLTNVDISNNLIEHDDRILDIFIQMPILACLYLRNNPCVREFKNYRKRLIGYISTLKYLDDRPVFINERRVAEAWIKDGRDGEMNERNAIIRERDSRNQKTFEETVEMNEQIKKKRRNVFMKAQEDYKKEVERIQRVIQKCKDENKPSYYIELLERDLEIEKQKIKDMEENLDKINVADNFNAVRSFSCTYNEDGSVSIWNKTEEQVAEIKKQFFDNPDVQRTKTREELEEERRLQRQEQMRQQQDEEQRQRELLKKQEEREEEERRQKEFIDYSKQWKTFMLADKEKEEKEKKQQEEYKQMSNPQFQSIKQLRQRWTDGDYDQLLETLLLSYVFDFERASIEFNKIVSEVMVRLQKHFLPFSSDDLRQIWTYIEVNKFRKNRSNEEYQRIQEQQKNQDKIEEQNKKEKEQASKMQQQEQQENVVSNQEIEQVIKNVESSPESANNNSFNIIQSQANESNFREKESGIFVNARKEIEELKKHVVINDQDANNLSNTSWEKINKEQSSENLENQNKQKEDPTSQLFKKIEDNALDLDGLD
ncbi:hypothetical protein ABPG74_017750 [Tetrahymena malaccensis]